MGGWIKCNDGQFYYFVDAGPSVHGRTSSGYKYDKHCMHTNGIQTVEYLEGGKWRIVGDDQVYQANQYSLKESPWAGLYNPGSLLDAEKWRQFARQMAGIGEFADISLEVMSYLLPGGEVELVLSLGAKILWRGAARLLTKEIVVASVREAEVVAAKTSTKLYTRLRLKLLKGKLLNME